MSYKKRQVSVRVQIRIDGELETDLRILYSLVKCNGDRNKISWNDFLVGIFTKYISNNSELVLKVREGISMEGE
jgi:hypothetical protein